VNIVAQQLGSAAFREAHGVKYAYVAGAMYKAIASRELVVRMARARLLAFYGTGGLTLARIADDLDFIARALPDGASFGANLLCDPANPGAEDALVELLLAHGVRRVEAAAYTQVTPALVRYRLRGLSAGADGAVAIAHHVLAKVSRPEVAQRFLAPAPPELVRRLLDAGQVSAVQAQLAGAVPMADDICVEADSGGHTDQGVALVLLPAILRLRDGAAASRVRVGAAGGLGAPEALAAAFILGADFVLTGSVNQCSPEAGMADVVKDLLQTMEVQDTAIAPAGDMFEMGAKVRVLRKGLLFPARANQLYELYRQHRALEDIAPAVLARLESQVFKRSIAEVWAETAAWLGAAHPEALALALREPKARMAQVFKWYFVHSARLARAGSPEQRADYQVHCGPALGAFNQWVRGSALEDWRARHVERIAEALMDGAAQVLTARFAALAAQAPLPGAID